MSVSPQANVCKQLQDKYNIRHVSLGGCQREAMKSHAVLGPMVKAAIDSKMQQDKADLDNQKKTDGKLCADDGLNADVLAWSVSEEVSRICSR